MKLFEKQAGCDLYFEGRISSAGIKSALSLSSLYLLKSTNSSMPVTHRKSISARADVTYIRRLHGHDSSYPISKGCCVVEMRCLLRNTVGKIQN